MKPLILFLSLLLFGACEKATEPIEPETPTGFAGKWLMIVSESPEHFSAYQLSICQFGDLIIASVENFDRTRAAIFYSGKQVGQSIRLTNENYPIRREIDGFIDSNDILNGTLRFFLIGSSEHQPEFFFFASRIL